GRAGEAVAPRPFGRLRDPDARARHDGDGLPARPELEGRRVERQAGVRTRHAERLAEPSRAGAEETDRIEPAPLSHRVDARARLERTDEDGVRDSDRLTHDVEAPVDPVRAVDVRMTGRPEHGRVARCASAIAMRGRILVVVRLDLDDHAADPVDV